MTDSVDLAAADIGVTEWPAGSNNVKYNDWFPSAGAWCAAAGSYWAWYAGSPLAAVNGEHGVTYCPSGQLHAYRNGQAVSVDQARRNDQVIYSWHPFEVRADGAWITSGPYAGEAAGDHWGVLVSVNGDGTITAIEGNTSVNGSQDNGGAVLLRRRDLSQVCCIWRRSGSGPLTSQEDDMFDANTHGVQLKGVFDALPMLRDLYLALGLEGSTTDEEKRDKVLRRYHAILINEMGRVDALDPMIRDILNFERYGESAGIHSYVRDALAQAPTPVPERPEPEEPEPSGPLPPVTQPQPGSLDARFQGFDERLRTLERLIANFVQSQPKPETEAK